MKKVDILRNEDHGNYSKYQRRITFFRSCQSINWKYDLSQETIEIAMDLTRSCI